MGCEQYGPLLVAYLHGELDPAERKGLERHLDACAECRHLLFEYRGVRAALARWEPITPSREAEAALFARVDELAGRRKRGRHPLLRLGLLAGRATAAVLVIAVLVAMLAAAWTLGSPLLKGRLGPHIAADPREAVVELHLHAGSAEVRRTGISLGNGQIVTTAWDPGAPAFDKIEVLWQGNGTAEAEAVKVDAERGLALLHAGGSSPPGLGSAGALSAGSGVSLIGLPGDVAASPPAPPARTEGAVEVVWLTRAAEGEVVATGVAMPDVRALPPSLEPHSGPYVEIRGETWQGLSGGLVLDAEGRPAGIVTLVQMLTSGAPGTAYALPLDEVRQWANTPEAPSATPVPGTAESRLGKLAFVRDGDIWVKELPDGAERRLTEDGKNAEPKWSPSGEWLAFAKEGQVWLMNADGADARQIATGGWFGWSPIDDHLAYEDNGLVVLEPAGGATRRLTGNAGTLVGLPPVFWSPDGRWLAYSTQEVIEPATQGSLPVRRAAIWRVSADGGEPQLVLDGGVPSSDGLMMDGWLLLSYGQTITFRVQSMFSASLFADGTPVMSASPEDGKAGVLLPTVLTHRDFVAVSTAANAVAAAVGAGRETWTNKKIAVLDLTSGQLAELTDPATAAISPSWSPDGRRIAYVAAADRGSAGGGQDALAERRIWVTNRDGSDKRQLTDDPVYRDERPRWSADGSQILFGRLKDDQLQLWLMNADGSEPRQVVERIGSPPDLSREAETWFGYYGHIDWDKEYDWWQPSTSAASQPTTPPPSTPTPSAGPTPTVTLPAATKELNDPVFKVILQYPGSWQPVEGYGNRYGGPDGFFLGGFFQLGALDGRDWTLSQACQNEVSHKLQPYGSNPQIQYLNINSDRRVACAIFPSADQDPGMERLATLIAPYSQPVEIDGATYSYFILHADQDHLLKIASQLRFADDAAAGTSAAASSGPNITYRPPPPDGRLTAEEAKQRVWAFLGENVPDLEVSLDENPRLLPEPAFYVRRYWQDAFGTTDTFIVNPRTGEVIQAGIQSNERPGPDSQPITESEAQAIAVEFARGRFAGFAELESVRAEADPPSDSSASPTKHHAVWQKRDAASGAWLPVKVSVDVSLQTGRVSGYQATRTVYDGPTIPETEEEQAKSIAKAEAAKSADWAAATVKWTKLEVVQVGDDVRLAWVVEFENEGKLLTDCVIDAISGQVLAFGGW